MKHTEGRLELRQDASSEGEPVYLEIWPEGRPAEGNSLACAGYAHEPEDFANARRLVACWNACQGISTEALESGLLAELRAAAKRLKRSSLDNTYTEFAVEDEDMTRLVAALARLEGEG